MLTNGPVGLLGCPGSGKTTLARALATQVVERTGAPLLVVATRSQEVFQDMYYAESVDDLTDVVWGEGDHAAFAPQSPKEFEAVMGAVYAARNVVVIVDELKNVVPVKTSIGQNFRNCLSEWRRVMAGCFITSQLYTDAGRQIKGLASEWYVFRMVGAEDRRDLRADYSFDPAVLENLPCAKDCALAGRPTSEAYVYKKVGF